MVFTINIEEETLKNSNYRKVINTQDNLQLVLMSLKPKEEIGMEIHETIDQFFRIEKGTAKVIINKNNKNNKNNKLEEIILKDGSVLIVPKNTYHNIINIGEQDLKLYSIYSPPNHPANKIEPIKQEGGKYLKYKSRYLQLRNNF
jgi:mannose-6-phosphate isomerase-like protein (cupin superfamily)